ncbi:MAG: hypothetical protein ACRDD8_06165 [Bacteroidales bacterium]
MKHRIGDKVKIKTLEQCNIDFVLAKNTHHHQLTNEMSKYCGKTLVVSIVYLDAYILSEPGGDPMHGLFFDDHMLDESPVQCEYCERGADLLSNEFHDNSFVRITDTNWLTLIIDGEEESGIKISNCPICGREL